MVSDVPPRAGGKVYVGPLCLFSAVTIVFGLLPAFGVVIEADSLLLLLPLGLVGCLVFGFMCLRKREYRWLIASLIVLCIPFGLLLLISAACSQSDCL